MTIYIPQEVSRDSHHVTLSLGRLSSAASGSYKCEVLAEHPSFRTESAQAFMTVLGEWLHINDYDNLEINLALVICLFL